jgi:hypothetical protein
MTREFSFFSRLVGASTALGLLAASIVAPASAMPLTSAGLNAQGDVLTVQFKPKPGGPGGGFKPGPGGPGHMGVGPGHQHWGGGGGGGHWHNGAWIPFAVGFGILGAAAAAAAYGAPPQPGMCWYYNDPTHTSGHWDYC